MFKSFSPPKYSTKNRNLHKSKSKDLNVLCKNCGYPYGLHYGDECPTEVPYPGAKINMSTVIPYRPKKKVSLKVEQIRTFKKLLLKYDMLEYFPERLKINGFLYLYTKTGGIKVTTMRDLYRTKINDWSNCYEWNDEDMDRGVGEIDTEWSKECANRGWN